MQTPEMIDSKVHSVLNPFYIPGEGCCICRCIYNYAWMRCQLPLRYYLKQVRNVEELAN